MNPERAARRLEIARRMEHLPKKADIKLHIRMLRPERRAHLRARVDWVEDYENHQQELDDVMKKQVEIRLEKKRQQSS